MLAIVAVALVTLVGIGRADAASVSFSWSQPQPVAASGVVDLTHMACAPNSTLCVGADLFDGDIAASANVMGGAGEWIVGNIDGRNVNSSGASESSITGLACPTTSLCVAVDDAGHILTSTHPAESTTAWHKIIAVAADGQSLTSIACPTESLCIAADSNGSVLTSTNPAGGSAAWSSTTLPATPAVVGCESASLCVTVSNTGEIMTSTEPTGGASKWSAPTASVDPGSGLTPTAISCAPGLCAFADSGGNVVSALEPAGGAAKWTIAAVASGQYLHAISCPSSGLCVVARGGLSGIYYSTNPHGEASEWKSFAPPHGEISALETIACASTTLCVGSFPTGEGNLSTGIATTTTPSTETATWTTATRLPQAAGLSHVSCDSKTLCAAIETKTGNILTSTDPAKEEAVWTTVTIDKQYELTGLSCAPSATLCVAIDGSGNVFVSTEPAGGASKWKATKITAVSPSYVGYLDAVSCPTTSFCTILDQAGHIITSTAPASGAWTVSEQRVSGNPIFNAVSCSSSTFCAATELTGDKVYTSIEPAGGASKWTATELGGASFLDTIACSSSVVCVAGGASANTYASSEPLGGPSKWVSESLEDTSGTACPATTLCVIAGSFGTLASATNPAEGVSAWSSTKVDFYERGLDSVSCPTALFCAAVDGNGDVITGSTLGPQNVVPPKIRGEAVVGTTLTEEHGTWTGGAILGYDYEWQRCISPTSCSKIPGAEAQNLVLTSEDQGFEIRVLERAFDSEGTSSPVASEVTSTVETLEEHSEHHSEEPKEETKSGGGSSGGSSGSTTGSSTSTTPVATAATNENQPGLTSTAVRAAIASSLTPPSKAALIPALLKKNGLIETVNAPEAGTLLIQWWQVPPGAHVSRKKSRAKAQLVAQGKMTFTGAGNGKVRIGLTSVGRRLLRHTKRLKLTVKAVFVPAEGAAVSATKVIVLWR